MKNKKFVSAAATVAILGTFTLQVFAMDTTGSTSVSVTQQGSTVSTDAKNSTGWNLKENVKRTIGGENMKTATGTTGAGAGKATFNELNMMRMHDASTTAQTIACVGAGVNGRETALTVGAGVYTQAVTGAYSLRGTALASAYTKTSAIDMKSAVKSAWSSFTSAIKSARGAWQTTRESAWKSYRTTIANCKASSGVSDGVYSESNAN